MMAKFCIIFFLFASLQVLPGLAAGSSHLSFESLTTDQGLVQNSAYSILQDKKGFIWIGTEEGINRYDGRRFTTFKHNNSQPNSISDNFIVEIFEDHLGRIWLGTRNGLNVYDEMSNSFVRIPLGNFSRNIYTPAIEEDINGNIWVGTDGFGLLRINIDSSLKTHRYHVTRFLHSATDGTTISSNTIFSLRRDFMDNLWVGTESGLCKIPAIGLNPPRSKIEFERIRIIENNQSVLDDERVSVIINHGNQLWVGTKGRHIYCLDYSDRKNQTWKTIAIRLKSTIPDNNPVITGMTFDQKGNLWLTNGDDGLTKIIFEEDTVIEQHYVHEKSRMNTLLSGPCLTIMKDRSEMLWIGTLNGISLINPLKERFYVKNYPVLDLDTADFNVQAFHLEGNRFYFFGTGGTAGTGLLIYDNVLRKTYRVEALSTLNIFCINKDDKGNFWVGTNNGLAYFQNADLFVKEGNRTLVNGKCTVRFFRKNPSDLNNSIQSNLVLSLAHDHYDRMWIGAGQGLSSLDINTEKITNVNLNPYNTSLFDERIIRDLLVDAENRLWIGTDGGLFQYNLSNNTFRKISGGNTDSSSLPSQRVVCLHADFQNQIWVGTNGGGISVYNQSSNAFRSFSEVEGLASSGVLSIQSDPSGILWVSTNKGISRFDPVKLEVTNFDARGELVSDQFNENSSMMTADGFIFFGGLKGYNSFHPDSIHVNGLIPPVVLTDFKLLDKSLLNDHTEFRKLIIEGKPMNFNYDENNFSFEFAALNFVSAEKNQYAVMLENFDHEWVKLGTRNFVSYTNLDPGSYTLRVKAANNDNVWNETGISIPFIITPPFYRTWWFRISLVIAITMLVYVYYREHISSIENRKEKEIALHRTQLKEQFLANMSHEIRTPLNAIMGMTRLLQEKNPKPEQLKYLNAITHSSDHLLVLINDILDFSKIEAGKVELENIPFNVRSTINNVHTTLRFKAEEKGLTFSAIISPEVPGTLMGDPVRLAQILINLAGNAIKFTAKGSVTINCTAEEIGKGRSRVVFSVIDTGVGIAKESIGKIFESFTQENSSVNREFGGTGLGLAISKRLIEMQGGQLDVSSVKGEGSTFNVVIPYAIAEKEADAQVVEMLDADMRRKMIDLRILLVDDNHFNQLVAIDTLELELTRARVDVAENGEEAIKLITENNYDIVLMDVQMPVMNGLDATRAIRKLPSPKNQTRIIAMTASAMKTEVERCFAAGMDDFVAKPFNSVELLKKMSRLVARLKVVA